MRFLLKGFAVVVCALWVTSCTNLMGAVIMQNSYNRMSAKWEEDFQMKYSCDQDYNIKPACIPGFLDGDKQSCGNSADNSLTWICGGPTKSYKNGIADDKIVRRFNHKRGWCEICHKKPGF